MLSHWLGAALGKCGLGAKVVLHIRVQQLGPLGNYELGGLWGVFPWLLQATAMARAKPHVECLLWMLPVLGMLSCGHLGFTARPCCPQGCSLHRACAAVGPVPPHLPAIEGASDCLLRKTVTLPVTDKDGKRTVVLSGIVEALSAVLRSDQPSFWRQWGASEEILAWRAVWSDLCIRKTTVGAGWVA